MQRLDHLIFGNSRGLASPYFDDCFYWLVDTSKQDRHGWRVKPPALQRKGEKE